MKTIHSLIKTTIVHNKLLMLSGVLLLSACSSTSNVVTTIDQISEVGKHHEYREKLLPAYVISYASDDALKAYVSVSDGKFQTVRHRNWRWFDFLWMTHTMDYEGRDNFNTIVLRAFSLLGLITVLSGFLLWYTSSPTIRKLIKNKIKKN